MSVIVGIAAGLALVVVGIRLFEGRFIYFPPRDSVELPLPEKYGLRVEEVWLRAEDNVRLNAWYLASPIASKVLLLFHGNATNLGTDLSRLQFFARLGVSLFEVDYRGYGKSEGSPDEVGLYRDANAAYRYLVEARGYKPRDILLHSQSLGGAVAIDLASRRECGGLIVESSFTSAREMARRMFLLPLLEYIPKSRFDSLRKIAQVRCPVLIVHGTQDQLIPFSMGQELYQATREPKSFLPVEGAGHADSFVVDSERYLERLGKFIGVASAAESPASFRH